MYYGTSSIPWASYPLSFFPALFVLTPTGVVTQPILSHGKETPMCRKAADRWSLSLTFFLCDHCFMSVFLCVFLWCEWVCSTSTALSTSREHVILYAGRHSPTPPRLQYSDAGTNTGADPRTYNWAYSQADTWTYAYADTGAEPILEPLCPSQHQN